MAWGRRSAAGSPSTSPPPAAKIVGSSERPSAFTSEGIPRMSSSVGQTSTFSTRSETTMPGSSANGSEMIQGTWITSL
jgi:hypothetical protein